MMKRHIIALACLTMLHPAFAVVISANGEGKAQINKKDVNLTRNEAFNAAKRDAVIALIDQVNGAGSTSDPTIKSKIDEISKQVSDSLVVKQVSNPDAEKNLVTKLTIEMDDASFRKILNDAGIAKKNSRVSPVMIVMDEYFTVPTDNQKPLKEYTEFFSDQSASYDEGASYDSSINAKSSSSSSRSASGRSSSSAAMYAADGWGAAAAGARSSSGYNSKSKNAESASLKASESASYGISARQNDVQLFRKYVEYQPRNIGAEKNNYTLNSILRETSRYDLRVMDSDLFRSKYLNGKSMSIAELTNDKELARFVAAAREEKSDFLMVGSSYIYDRGYVTASGVYVCDGVVSLKAYSTLDGQALAADTRSTSANAKTADACRAEVASKLGQMAISEVGARILDNSKNRSMYGNEYTVYIKSASGGLSSGLADELYLALEEIDGASNVDIRRTSDKEQELVLSYKNSRPFTVSLTQALRKNSPALAAANRSQDGNSVTLCVGSGKCQ